jgi:hypothetical protein
MKVVAGSDGREGLAPPISGDGRSYSGKRIGGLGGPDQFTSLAIDLISRGWRRVRDVRWRNVSVLGTVNQVDDLPALAAQFGGSGSGDRPRGGL